MRGFGYIRIYICTSCLPFAGADSRSQWDTSDVSSVRLDLKGPVPAVYTRRTVGCSLMEHTGRTIIADSVL